MILLMLIGGPAIAAEPPEIRITRREKAAEQSLSLTPSQMFEAADLAQRKRDFATAEAIYRALSSNPSAAIRNEARFRLARMAKAQHRLTEAALLLRNILDEQPNAQPVRLELASVLVMMGDEAGARRELRAVRAGQLPPAVARQVDRFSEALRARKPFGGTIDIGLASDSNVNRATRSDTLGTVIGDFTLDKDARARSGQGVAVQGQVYRRIPLGARADLLGSVSGSGNFYRQSRFDDLTLGASLGPEFKRGQYQLNVRAGASRRWYGGAPFTDAATLQTDVARPVSATAELRGSAAASRIWNHLNPLESGHSFSGSIGTELALSTTTGGGLTLTGIRQALRDPGYSTTSGQLSVFGWHEAGRVTLTAALTGGRLVADQRLLLYLHRRDETLYRATLGLTARQVHYKGFAPTASITWERNRSPIEIYDYARTVFNVGVTRAF
jgi:hypothetical protein